MAGIPCYSIGLSCWVFPPRHLRHLKTPICGGFRGWPRGRQHFRRNRYQCGHVRRHVFRLEVVSCTEIENEHFVNMVRIWLTLLRSFAFSERKGWNIGGAAAYEHRIIQECEQNSVRRHVFHLEVVLNQYRKWIFFYMHIYLQKENSPKVHAKAIGIINRKY